MVVTCLCLFEDCILRRPAEKSKSAAALYRIHAIFSTSDSGKVRIEIGKSNGHLQEI